MNSFMLASHRAVVAIFDRTTSTTSATRPYRPVVRDGYGSTVWIGIKTYRTQEEALGVARAIVDTTRFDPSEILE